MGTKIKGRAETPEEKRQVIEVVLRMWERTPTLRLGQFLENVAATIPGGDLFGCEDKALAERCALYVQRAEAMPRTQPGDRRD